VAACAKFASSLRAKAIAGVSTDACKRSGTVVAIDGAGVDAIVGPTWSVGSRRRKERVAEGSGNRSGVSSKRFESAIGMLSRDIAGTTGVGGCASDVDVSDVAAASDVDVISDVDAGADAVVTTVGVSATGSNEFADGDCVASCSMGAASSAESVRNVAPH
jgi:hypothetical protein